MFDGLGNEIITVSEYYLNHPLTIAAYVITSIMFIAIMVLVLVSFIKNDRKMKNHRRRR